MDQFEGIGGMASLDALHLRNMASTTDLRETLSKIKTLDKENVEHLISSIQRIVMGARTTSEDTIANSDMLFRTYYKALDTIGGTDDVALPSFDSYAAETKADIFYGVLLADYHKKVASKQLQQLCQQIVDSLGNSSAPTLLTSVRSVNLFYNRYPNAKLEFTLTKFYSCLQSQSPAVRDECIIFFRNWLKNGSETEDIFLTIAKHWPWTNKYKYILLSVILTDNKLVTLLPTEQEVCEFLQGSRLSLKHKNLFSVGQLVVKALSKQNCNEFNELLIGILKTGSHAELISLNSQWMHYVLNKDDLFTQIGLDQELENILKLDYVDGDHTRLVLLCTIFERQFYKHPQVDGICEYLQNNYAKFNLDAQLYVYKFIVGLLIATNRSVHERLQFIIVFVEKHVFVPCSDFRNTVLGKLPLVLDFLSKKIKTFDQAIVIEFFTHLKRIFHTGITHSEYQPLIFNLKMFEILLKCFESETHKSLMKNSSVNLHKTLARVLAEGNVWTFQDEYETIFALLSSAGDFDDVRELIVRILKQLVLANRDEEFKLWKKFVGDPGIDKCALSAYYARLYIHRSCSSREACEQFLEFSLDRIKSNIAELEADPLNACKTGRHIFGYFQALNELFKNQTSAGHITSALLKIAVGSAESAVNFVLRRLNLAGNEEGNASFQTMEESLEMLVSDSQWPSEVHSTDRKFLLLSFWLTLKACCELATSIGLLLTENSEENDEARELLKKCLHIQATILHGCRHKGAIEAAGVSLGLLVKGMSRSHASHTQTYKILYDCFDVLFGSVNKTSTTRRGAGLSIMFHHFIKNDAHKSRPLFQYAIKILLEHVKKSRSPAHLVNATDDCHDNFDALVLHYLCVLVRDSDLKDSISEYYDEIMMASIVRINDKEWSVRNGALQLFGALVPKIVGQKQAVTGDEEPPSWDPSEITFTEFCIKLPKTNAYILAYCKESRVARKSISSIILFLEFLSNIDFIKKEERDNYFGLLLEYREILWCFLSHYCEKVRKLSSKCLARFHDFHNELPDLVLSAIKVIFTVTDENFVHGLIFFFIHAIHKLNLETQFILSYQYNDFPKLFREELERQQQLKIFSPYVKTYLLVLFELVKFDLSEDCVREMLAISFRYIHKASSTNFGLPVLKEKMDKIKKCSKVE